jgi:ABC-2 type transport system permease protein
MNLYTFLKLELKNFLSGRAVVLSFLCVLLAGSYGAFHGANVVEKQRRVIAELPALEAEHREKLLGIKKNADLADALYYLTFQTADAPSDWAAVSVGQRDVNPYNVKVRMLALEGQIYDSELVNPTNLLFGNFDLSFVVVFLFPLLIIAFTHNLISSEQESGTWQLLRSQPISALKIVGWRLALRFALVFAAAILMLLAGCLATGARLDERFAAACLLTFVYFAFWFGVAALVISFGRGSTFNALSLLGVWIFLVLLAPAVLSSVVSTVFPVSESMETAVEQREGYHEKWDKPKRDTMNRFYQKYPEFAHVPIPEDRFSWGWYYAMQQMGDEEAADARGRFRQKLEQRSRFTSRAAWFLPPVAAQLRFNDIAETDLKNHLRYLDSVRDFHEKIRRTFYPHIFSDAKVADFDFETAPRHEFAKEARTNLSGGGTLTIAAAAILFAALGWLNLRRRISQL